MSVIVVSFRTIRMDDIHWGALAVSILFYFLCGLLNWFILNQFIIKYQNAAGYNKWGPVSSILLIVVLQFILDWTFSSQLYKVLMLDESGTKWYRVLVFRSLVVGGFYYFVVHHFYIERQRQQNLIEIAQLKEVQLQANLSSLKEQLSPHFLFNTLNTLSSISQEEDVKEYITELSNVYRYLLSFQKKNAVTVEEELEFVTSYTYIIKARMEAAIDIEVDINEETLKTSMPPLTLQLLIENAVKHNVASVAKPLRVLITDKEPGWLKIINNFQLRSYTQPTTETGLDNIQQRYQLLFAKDISIEQTNDFFTVKLPVVQQ
jgi:two-component system LytT family sensor kinase